MLAVANKSVILVRTKRVLVHLWLPLGNCQAHERAYTCTGYTVVQHERGIYSDSVILIDATEDRCEWLYVYTQIESVCIEKPFKFRLPLMHINIQLLKLGMEMQSNPFGFKGFNVIWFDALLSWDISCICNIFYIKNWGRGKLKFLLERLELAVVIWISQLSTQSARVCHQWSTSVLPSVTFQEA